VGRPKKSAPVHVEPEFESQDIPDEEPAAIIEPEESEGDGPNKSEAARQAIKAGYDKPATALPWIKKTFGIEMGAQHFSAIKSQYLKKQAAEAPKAEPAKRGPKPKAAASPAPTPSQAAPAPRAASNGSQADLMTALEGVKELVGQFGADQVKRMVDLLG
jgi:hypothetical protein